MTKERINWWVVGPTTVVGAGAIALGLWLGDWTKSSWSSVSIEVGAAVALVSAIVLLERRVVRQVAEAAGSVARAEAERVTADLRGRIESLEDLDAAQRETRAAQRAETAKRLDSVRQGEVTPEAIGGLLVAALNDRIFAPDEFHVRTSPDPACPVLYALPFVDLSRVVGVYLDFEPFVMADWPIVLDGHPIPVPVRNDATVLWMEEDGAVIGAALEAGLERRNEPIHGFGFGYAMGMLSSSIHVMREARGAPSGDPRRIKGALRCLINDAWAYTTEGLEAVADTVILPVKATGWEAGSNRLVGPHMFLAEEERRSAGAALAEALAWVEDREHVSILKPGEDPADAFFRRGR